jgi:hypothetical protein
LEFDEVFKREARKAKRRRWKENKRRRETAWNDLNDAWEEPENDELIRNLYDPVDMDELPNGDEHYNLGDYAAQYDDAWEEPWWDELTSEREAAEAEDAAFLDQYSSSNNVIAGRKLAVEQLMQQYKIGTVVSAVINGRTTSYAVVGQVYDEHTDKLMFAI